MSKTCQITGKRPLVGNNVSKSHRKTKRKQFPNLQTRKLYVPEIGKKFKLIASACNFSLILFEINLGTISKSTSFSSH